MTYVAPTLICKPPHIRYPVWRDPRPTVFLAGSIEMGAAEDWQAQLGYVLFGAPSIIYNPRREDWDSSWDQSINHPQFTAQVNWELEFIDRADIALFYFDPATKSPITLMELGLIAGADPSKAIVCCPDGFWRKGNVDILCERYRMKTADSLEELATKALDFIPQLTG